jgi:hypothetical protein
MKHPAKLAFFAVVTGLLISAGALWGLQPFTLPDFQLSSLDGKTIKSGDLAMSGHWLLVYVDRKNQFSNQLLAQFMQEQNGASSRMVIVVGATLDEAKAMRSQHPYLSQAAWYADPSGSIFRALKLHGVPVTIGVSRNTMEWNINGALPDSAVQKSIVDAWIQ